MTRGGALLAAALLALSPAAAALDLSKPAGTLRVAQFNAALVRHGAGLVLADIAERDAQVLAVAEIVLRVRPDVLLVNELDADPEGRSLDAFAALLAEGVAGLDGLAYPHRFQGPQNTGVPSDMDLDRDGRAAGPGDAWGYGRFPGQYAMALLSRLPLAGEPRSWRLVRWAEMPGARRPVTEDGAPFHPEAVWQALRLSSKAHWAVPLALPDGRTLHLVAAHTTPPVFDGPEDRNGRRNADEIRLLRAILDGAPWLRDDAGRPGGVPQVEPVVVAGDLNADPVDGDGIREAIRRLLAHPRLQDPGPTSPGGAAAGGGGPRAGDPALHTSDWPDAPDGPGNLRVDYVLPSTDLEVAGAGVFWPAPGEPLARLTQSRGRRADSSDHRLVWVDLRPGLAD